MRKYRNLACSVLALVIVSAAALLDAHYANCQTFSATTGGLAQPLIDQIAIPLQNGNILIFGGVNASGVAPTYAQIYNPAPGVQTFSPTLGSLNVARGCGSTATLLNDGTVLIAGGSGNTTAELYIPSTGQFSLRTPPTPLDPANPNGLQIGPMTAVRCHATATLLQNGTVLIAGGDIGDWAGLTSAEIYNPATGAFTATTGNMSKRRTTHTATLLPNGTVLIAGGQGNYSGQTAWNTAETYNPSTQTFTLVGDMTTTRCWHTATLLANGTVLLAGGQNTSGTTLSSAEIYTPASATFAATGSMNSARMNHTATPLADGTVLVAGGFPNITGSNNATNTAEIYSLLSQTFTLTGNMTEPRAYHSATMLYDGQILIAGGEDMDIYASSILSSAELYSYPVSVAYMNPGYRVTSILYAPPGNKSQSGFLDTTTTATTTTIGSSFASGGTVTTNLGFSAFGVVGVNASDSFGTSTTSSSSAAFQSTYTDATGVANSSNNSAPDAIDHNQDEFLVWLNPQITLYGNDLAPVTYNLGVQPFPNGTAAYSDVVQVWANTMEANSAGVSTVPAETLGQQEFYIDGSYVYEPGLASICKNLIQAEYNPPSGPPSTCTLADQCGCTPTDFLPILQTDPLLFYNGMTNPIAPFPGTVSPLQANTSSGGASDEACGTLPTPNLTGADCRYVPVPETLGSSFQAEPHLTGPGSAGGNGGPGQFNQGENTQTTYTLGGQIQTTASQSLSFTSGTTGKIAPGGSSGSGNWGLGSTMSWTDSQSVGTASGSAVSQNLTLNSGTVGCGENVPIFEDTIYHTFVFQELANGSCTTMAPSFSVAMAPPLPPGLTVGGSASYTVDATASYGFNGTVALSVSGLPAGVTASLSPASITTSSVGSATLTLTAATSGVYIGNVTVIVTGTSGSSAVSADIPLTISQATPAISIGDIPSSATAGGNFPVTYNYSGTESPTLSVLSSTTGACTVSGNTVNFVAAGTCTLTASATATPDYTPVTGGPQSFAVSAASAPFITLANNEWCFQSTSANNSCLTTPVVSGAYLGWSWLSCCYQDGGANYTGNANAPVPANGTQAIISEQCMYGSYANGNQSSGIPGCTSPTWTFPNTPVSASTPITIYMSGSEASIGNVSGSTYGGAWINLTSTTGTITASSNSSTGGFYMCNGGQPATAHACMTGGLPWDGLVGWGMWIGDAEGAVNGIEDPPFVTIYNGQLAELEFAPEDAQMGPLVDTAVVTGVTNLNQIQVSTSATYGNYGLFYILADW